MTEECWKLLEKASRAVKAAETLMREGESEFAVGRAYYAMFYTASALLAARGLRFRKHSGVHAAYGAEFAKTGKLDPKFHRWLIDAFDKRVAGDYGVEAVLTAEDAALTIAQAREFLEAASHHLESVARGGGGANGPAAQGKADTPR